MSANSFHGKFVDAPQGLHDQLKRVHLGDHQPPQVVLDVVINKLAGLPLKKVAENFEYLLVDKFFQGFESNVPLIDQYFNPGRSFPF